MIKYDIYFLFGTIIPDDVLQFHGISLSFPHKDWELFHLICGVSNVMVHEADYSTSASFVQLIKHSALYYV